MSKTSLLPERNETIEVLAIDDDPDDINLLDRLFEELEYKEVFFDAANTADRGQKKLEESEYDLVFVDHFLNNTEGLELVRKVREDGLETPIVLLTGVGDENLAATAIRQGCSDYIPKKDLSAVRLEQSIRHINEEQLKKRHKKQRDKFNEMLVKEIHHRIKNNLQILSALISFEQNREEIRPTNEILDGLNLRIQAMSLIHEGLFGSNEYTWVDFPEYLDNLVKRISAVYGKRMINVNYKINFKKMGFDIAIPCGLIINELVTNCYEHAFANDQPGQIDIHFTKKNDILFDLSVSDDGNGMKKLPANDCGSFGIHTVEALAESQLGGKYQIETSPETGTKVTVEFPVRKQKEFLSQIS